MDVECEVNIKEEPQEYESDSDLLVPDDIFSAIENDASFMDVLRSDGDENRRYPCDMCDKAYKRKAHLNRHRVLHTGERPYICEVCNNRFKRSEDRMKHIRVHHPGFVKSQRPTRSFDCFGCGESFRMYDELHDHRPHCRPKIKPDSWKPIEVKQPSPPIQLLPDADPLLEEIYHEGDQTERRYRCELCGKMFIRNDHLTRHREIHAGKRYPCRFCPRGYTRKDTTVRHEQECLYNPMRQLNGKAAMNFAVKPEKSEKQKFNIAISDVVSIGEIQNKQTSMPSSSTAPPMNASMFSDLLENVFDEKPKFTTNNHHFTMPSFHNDTKESMDLLKPIGINPMHFKPIDTLPNEIKPSMYGHPQNRSADDSGMISGTSLYPRLTDEEKATLECEMCGRKMSSRCLLRRHKATHQAIKPFKCLICDKRYTRKDHLKTHQRTHTKRQLQQQKIANEITATPPPAQPEPPDPATPKIPEFCKDQPELRSEMIGKFRQFATNRSREPNFYEDCFDFVASMVAEKIRDELASYQDQYSEMQNESMPMPAETDTVFVIESDGGEDFSYEE